MKKWFWILFFSYLFVYSANRMGIVFPFLIQNYWNDLLVVPIVAPLSVWVVRLITRDNTWTLKGWHVVYIVLVFSICFEWIIPKHSNRYTADFYDVVMYCIGAILYWVCVKKQKRNPFPYSYSE